MMHLSNCFSRLYSFFFISPLYGINCVVKINVREYSIVSCFMLLNNYVTSKLRRRRRKRRRSSEYVV